MQSNTVQGFKVIPIKFATTSSSQHELFVKVHSVRNQTQDKPADHTLFVLNVPPYATEDSLKTVFSCAGSVKNVIFQSKPNIKENESDAKVTGFKVAYIVFEKSSSVQKALNLTSLPPLSTEDHPVLTGVRKWASEYNNSIYDHTELEENVNKFMAKYDKEEKIRKQEKQKDDGGWTVVTKKGRNPGLSRKESVRNKLLEKTNKGVKRKHLDDFYTFQKRESKMQHLVEMRKKYEQDKKKVEAMKQARNFKPF